MSHLFCWRNGCCSSPHWSHSLAITMLNSSQMKDLNSSLLPFCRWHINSMTNLANKHKGKSCFCSTQPQKGISFLPFHHQQGWTCSKMSKKAIKYIDKASYFSLPCYQYIQEALLTSHFIFFHLVFKILSCCVFCVQPKSLIPTSFGKNEKQQ